MPENKISQTTEIYGMCPKCTLTFKYVRPELLQLEKHACETAQALKSQFDIALRDIQRFMRWELTAAKETVTKDLGQLSKRVDEIRCHLTALEKKQTDSEQLRVDRYENVTNIMSDIDCRVTKMHHQLDAKGYFGFDPAKPNAETTVWGRPAVIHEDNSHLYAQTITKKYSDLEDKLNNTLKEMAVVYRSLIEVSDEKAQLHKEKSKMINDSFQYSQRLQTQKESIVAMLKEIESLNAIIKKRDNNIIICERIIGDLQAANTKFQNDWHNLRTKSYTTDDSVAATDSHVHDPSKYAKGF